MSPTAEQQDVARDTSAAHDESFTARLRYLFASRRQRDGSAWTLSAVARATQGRLSLQQISKLYYGKSANPQLETVAVLAEVFGVAPEYFVRTDALASLQSQDATAFSALEADPQVVFVSRRMGAMSPADKALLVDLARRLDVGDKAEFAWSPQGTEIGSATQFSQQYEGTSVYGTLSDGRESSVEAPHQVERDGERMVTEMSRDLAIPPTVNANERLTSKERRHGTHHSQQQRSRSK